MRTFTVVRPPLLIRVLLRLLLFGVVITMLFRLVLFALNAPLWRTASAGDVVGAFLDRGLLFDLHVHCLILALPALLLIGAWLIDSPQRWPVVVARWAYTALFIVLVAFSSMDIPFFRQFNFRITRAALTWMDTPWQSIKEVFTTPGYFMAFVAMIGIGWSGVAFIGRVFRPLMDPPLARREPMPRPRIRVALSIPWLLLMLIGVRSIRRRGLPAGEA